MAKADLVTFVPAEDFTGYPDGKKTAFKAGVESQPVPAEFAALMREKGHAAPARAPRTPE